MAANPPGPGQPPQGQPQPGQPQQGPGLGQRVGALEAQMGQIHQAVVAVDQALHAHIAQHPPAQPAQPAQAHPPGQAQPYQRNFLGKFVDEFVGTIKKEAKDFKDTLANPLGGGNQGQGGGH